MPRFFVNRDDIFPGHIIIGGDDVKHIKNVLRLKPGDEITLCDGRGTDYRAVIQEFGSSVISAGIKEAGPSPSEPAVEATLFQGIPKSDKMDFIIQKSVELGISRIVPVMNARTVVRFRDGKDMDKKTARWQRISLEAAKQCGRGIIPRVSVPLEFCEALELAADMDYSIIPYENCSGPGIRECLAKSEGSRVAYFVGPEGGFEEDEIDKACQKGVIPVTLGPRILRTETAAVTVLTILMYEKGDIGG